MRTQGESDAPATPDRCPPFLRRWWAYQRERFPLFGHGPLVAAFSFSAVCFSALLRGRTGPPPWPAVVTAFVTCLLLFLQLRIADEFKDFEEDSRWRPYRPVPRGLVTLRELAGLWVITGAIQLALALWLEPSLTFLLLVVWTYLALMSKEFFVKDWLKARPVLYMTSHMVIMPLVDYYATACDWWPAGEGQPDGLLWFVAVSYFNGLVIEIGRKVRSPADEEEGVETYSALWGPRKAVLVWLGAMLVTAGCAAAAAARIDFLAPMAVLLAVLLLTAVTVAVRFVRQMTPGRGKSVEAVAAVWTLLMYLGLGTVPLLWRWAQS
jgi:4-hydroxybenzoate polyprenyltransferase